MGAAVREYIKKKTMLYPRLCLGIIYLGLGLIAASRYYFVLENSIRKTSMYILISMFLCVT